MIEVKRLPEGVPLDVEFLQRPGRQTPHPHRHEYFQIFWVLEGEGSQSIDFREFPMMPGQVFFIAPGQVHDVHAMPQKMVSVSFNPEFISSREYCQQPIDRLFLRNRSTEPYISLDELGGGELLGLLEMVGRELARELPDRDLMSALLVGYLRYMMRYLDEGDDSDTMADKRMVRLLNLIDDNFRERKDVAMYAQQLSMTSKRLNELSKQRFSRTVTQLIHDKVTVEARRELAFTQKTIKTISFKLGYKDTSYFCRFFKRMSGQSPQAFRSEWKR
ncbi:AraC family transcriptional regulator [Ferrimonas sp. YFM]|uniref:helix-turn-helix transcriptional regulator n=1 Tax=Ferrimonas sp. YFM TaxID=3028878 RepID=UPI00257437D4|nr:AraC family transcriptional regulator [Ferrimonas sp. YFM]BDY07031.1 transcriptional regulator [Ferrimonas sp. YFM]